MTSTSVTGYRPSRFNLMAWDTDADGSRSLLVFNSLSSGFVRLWEPTAGRAEELLTGGLPIDGDGDGDDAGSTGGELVGRLVEQGMVVSPGVDEKALVARMQGLFRSRRDTLNLILMPTEKCFFRCVYCYEELVKGKMAPAIRSGLVRLVERELSEGSRRLKVDWFGGEPLSAMDVLTDLSAQFMRRCAEHGADYSATMTTNAFLLTPDRVRQCLDMRISRFQITLDGPQETHDSLRVLANGRGTFDTIIENLVRMRGLSDDFHVRLRVNFTPQVAARIPEFLAFLGDRFGGDQRFSVWFHPVGRWGGPHDEEIEVCGARESEQLERDFMVLAARSGFSFDSWRNAMKPFGSVCYAADPRSYVIGSDGVVYKCTVAFSDPQNQVGRLDADGDLNLSDDRLATWIASGAEQDTGCQSCAFQPSCQGNACPMERWNQDGERACPPLKKGIRQVLPLLAVRPGTPAGSVH